jgi:N-succinyldiaminopimelate aminotransferase
MLESVFSGRTKLVALINPLNPAAVAFAEAVLVLLAEFCVRYDVVAVWKQVVFAPHRRRPLIGFPGMRERCVKIGSAGKVFALTGWKVGFLCAAPALTQALAKTHPFLSFTTPPNLQAAIAWGLRSSDDGFARMPINLARSLARPADRRPAPRGLLRAGEPGAYFLNLDLTASGIAEGDADFCMRAIREHGAASILVLSF